MVALSFFFWQHQNEKPETTRNLQLLNGNVLVDFGESFWLRQKKSDNPPEMQKTMISETHSANDPQVQSLTIIA